MKRWINWFGVLLMLILTACDEDSMALFKSTAPKVDERVKNSLSYLNTNMNNEYPEIEVAGDDYRVYVFSDTHVATVNTILTRFVETFREDKEAPVAVCLGDQIEANHSYYWFNESFRYMEEPREKHDTVFSAVGNHDIFFDCYWHFIERWKMTAYCFSVVCRKGKTKDLYICLDTASGTIGKVQYQWLQSILSNAKNGDYRYIFVYTHVNIFRTDNTNADISTVALEETRELMYLFSKYGVQQFWAGHDHARDVFQQGGVQYIMLDSMAENDNEPAYMILHVSPQGLNNTFHIVK